MGRHLGPGFRDSLRPEGFTSALMGRDFSALQRLTSERISFHPGNTGTTFPQLDKCVAHSPAELSDRFVREHRSSAPEPVNVDPQHSERLFEFGYLGLKG